MRQCQASIVGERRKLLVSSWVIDYVLTTSFPHGLKDSGNALAGASLEAVCF
jgi:hypothetical protein